MEFKKMNFQDFFYNNKFINERHYVIKKIKNFLSKERFDKISSYDDYIDSYYAYIGPRFYNYIKSKEF